MRCLPFIELRCFNCDVVPFKNLSYLVESVIVVVVIMKIHLLAPYNPFKRVIKLMKTHIWRAQNIYQSIQMKVNLITLFIVRATTMLYSIQHIPQRISIKSSFLFLSFSLLHNILFIIRAEMCVLMIRWLYWKWQQCWCCNMFQNSNFFFSCIHNSDMIIS